MPPVLFPNPNGQGLLLHLGEFLLSTTFHSSSAGDAKVKVAVSVIAGANIALSPDGQSITVSATHDLANTHFVAELRAVESGKQDAADELAGILTTFSPVLEGMIADDLPLPPIAIPQIDLGLVTPGLAGRKATFDGSLKFDPVSSRIALAGRLIAK
jgi:hypothetical protein